MVHGVPFASYPNEVAQCQGDPHHGGRGARCLPAVGRNKNAEHQLQGQNQLHRHGLAGRDAAPDLGEVAVLEVMRLCGGAVRPLGLTSSL